LFGLALRTGLLTILTLGLYRFWMKTRLRRWYWSAIRPGGQPMEYVGEPLEKLLGFLIAVVILAFYIGVANLILMFLSLSLFADNFAAYAVSFLGVIPLWFYARYRARRYILARTRWRGVRFGLEKGAWGYTWRAILHWLSVICTVGILWPRMTFWLEKYRTDRTFFGSARMHQGGEWQMLIPATAHVLIGAIFSVGFFFAGIGENPNMLWMLIISGPWFLFGLVYYRVETLRIMANEKSAEGVKLTSDARAFKVFRTYLFGYLAIGIMLIVPFSGLGIVVALLEEGQPGGFLGYLDQFPQWLVTGVGLLLYFTFFLLWNVLTQVFITMPVIRHYAETLGMDEAEKLAAISQRERDEFTEAEGFAEALDVGAAI
jgi:hypothetical protein